MAVMPGLVHFLAPKSPLTQRNEAWLRTVLVGTRVAIIARLLLVLLAHVYLSPQVLPIVVHTVTLVLKACEVRNLSIVPPPV